MCSLLCSLILCRLQDPFFAYSSSDKVTVPCASLLQDTPAVGPSGPELVSHPAQVAVFGTITELLHAAPDGLFFRKNHNRIVPGSGTPDTLTATHR